MTTSPKSRPQISIALMILMMSIFAVMSAGMFYASRVGAIQDEISIFGGGSSASESNRTAHLIFLMFTYTSPLLLAMILGTIVSVMRFLNRPTVTRRVTSPPGTPPNSTMKPIVTFLLITLSTADYALAETKPVKVFIIAGQSNMEGAGQIRANPQRNGGQGSLEYLIKSPATANQFAPLVDATGNWRVRDDVWISYLDRQGPLTVGYGSRKETIGPELGFGWAVGDAIDEPVLLIKCAWGGKSLAVDFRPPSAGMPPYSLGKETDADIAKDPAIIGKYYRDTLSLTQAALANLKDIIPGYDGRFELTGFGWHQGWNDRINDKFNAEYESNMIHFIKDFRKDLGAPSLPVVIAETGMNGPDETHPRALSLMKAQAAVAEHLEFKGNVAFVETRNFWRPADQSPSGQGYHWNSNAETYFLIGQSMGHAMKRLLDDVR